MAEVSDEMEVEAAGPGATSTHPDMLQTDRRFDNEAMRAVFDKGSAYWAALVEHPAIAAALAKFPSEKQTRKTSRLDLVAWVHVISAFGVDGPADSDWDQLFTACCFEAPHEPEAPIPYMRESYIAVILAFAKVTEDVAENTTHANIIKQRIRPAVIGRVEARAPGIIYQVQRKYDSFVYSYINKGFVMNRIMKCQPELVFAENPDLIRATSSMQVKALYGCDGAGACEGETSYNPLYGTPVSPSCSDIPGRFEFPCNGRNMADVIRELAHSHAVSEVKTWESTMSLFLNLDLGAPVDSPRMATFLRERDDVRAQFQDGLCTRFSLYFWDKFDTSSARYPLEDPHRFYKHASACSIASLSTGFALNDGSGSDILGDEGYIFNVYGDALLGTQEDMRARIVAQTSASNTVLARVTVLELHAPSSFGLASLDFAPCLAKDCGDIDEEPTSPMDIRNSCSGKRASNGLACFRLADPTSSSSLIKVPGVSPSNECRALQLIVEVNVLPLDANSTVRSFRYNRIKSYEWVSLGSEATTDSCEEMEVKSEMIDFDDNNMGPSDNAPDWLRRNEVAVPLASGEGLSFRATETCNSIKQVPIDIRVPTSLLAHVDRTAGLPIWASERETALFDDTILVSELNDSSEEVFHATIGIDCCATVQFSYEVNAGIEVTAGNTTAPGLFAKSSSWKWRHK